MGQKVSWCPEGDVDRITAKIVAQAAREGDPLAKEVYEISSRHLGIGLSVVMDILNPELIVIGSIYSRNEDMMKPFCGRGACERGSSSGEQGLQGCPGSARRIDRRLRGTLGGCEYSWIIDL